MTISPFLLWTLFALYGQSGREKTKSVADQPEGVEGAERSPESRRMGWLLDLREALNMLLAVEMSQKCSHTVAGIAIVTFIVAACLLFLVRLNLSMMPPHAVREVRDVVRHRA